MRRALALVVLCTLLVVAVGRSPSAHFNISVNIRVIHVERLEDGFRVYLRLPMALVAAGLVGAPDEDGNVAPAPYTSNRIEDGRLMHYLDVDAVRGDPDGLGRLVADGHMLIVDGRPISGEVEAVRAFPALKQTPFVALPDVKASFDGPPYPEDAAPDYVGDVVLDVQLFYPTDSGAAAYAFGSNLDPGVPGQENLANLLLDYAGGEPTIYRAIGVLAQPIAVDAATRMVARTAEAERDALNDARRFVVEGVRHIVSGIDHVLFVVCLTLGATGLVNLLWRITGFTLGHTVTLIAGFFGYAPQGDWFVPTVEAGIALTIIYAGLVAVFQRAAGATFLVTAAFGLLHGFGFSFILHEILKVDSPNLWVSLISFNIGVEIGQIALVAVVWPVLVMGYRYWPGPAAWGRNAVALTCTAIAVLWTYERITILVA